MKRLRPTPQRSQPVPRPLVTAARRSGWQMNPGRRAFLRDLDTELSSRDRATVAVLSRPKARHLERIIAEVFPGAHVVWVDATKGPSATHVMLAAHGPFDVLVDDTARRSGKPKRFREVFGHVRSGGVLLMRHPPGSTGLPGYVSALLARRAIEAEASADRTSPEAVLAQSLGRVVLGERHVVVQNTLDFLAKMREDEMTHLTNLRSGKNARLLDSRAPREFRSLCTVRENIERHNPRMKETYTAPQVSLREYDGAVCVPGQVAVQGNLLLPDTYRHNQQKHLNNRFTVDVTPRFGRVIADISEPRALAGTYYYLDNELRGHFGHTMTEQVAKLWAWPLVQQAHPDVKGLVSFRPKVGRVSKTELRIFAAAGIDEDRLAVIDGPVLLEKLVAATPMFSMPAYVHPDIRETWARIGRTLAADTSERAYPRRIFCARRVSKRSCRNAAEVESLFAAHGFEVIYPEEFSLGEQVRMFREAEVVAGFAGSGLFTLSFCESPKRVVMISSESYTATNEYLIGSVLGHEIDLFWCTPDRPQPAAGHSKEAFESDFSFDFERDGDRLRGILASI